MSLVDPVGVRVAGAAANCPKIVVKRVAVVIDLVVTSSNNCVFVCVEWC